MIVNYIHLDIFINEFRREKQSEVFFTLQGLIYLLFLPNSLFSLN